jgi:type IV pilus assembly protein PilM
MDELAMPLKSVARRADHLPSTMRRRVNRTPLVGLEIEPSAVTAVAADVNGKIVVRHAATVALDGGVVRDGEVTDVDALAAALRTLFNDNRDLDKRVRIGLANQKVVVRIIELPPIADAKELAAAVRFRAQDEIAMPLDSAVLDFQELDVILTDDGPRQRVLVVAARRDMIDRVLSAARAAGLRPEGVDLAAFAMVRALHRASPTDEQVLYLSIGGLTNLAVAQGTTCLFTRVVGGSLESLAVELAERRGLTLDQAREKLAQVGLERDLEENEGDADVVDDARAILAEGVRRIAGEVRNSLDFHHAQGGDIAVSRAVLTGPAAAVPGFAAALAAELDLAVEAGVLAGVPNGMDAARLTVAAGLAVEEAGA